MFRLSQYANFIKRVKIICFFQWSTWSWTNCRTFNILNFGMHRKHMFFQLVLKNFVIYNLPENLKLNRKIVGINVYKINNGRSNGKKYAFFYAVALAFLLFEIIIEKNINTVYNVFL